MASMLPLDGRGEVRVLHFQSSNNINLREGAMNAEEQIPLAWTRKRSVIEIPYEVNYMHRELINLRSCINL